MRLIIIFTLLLCTYFELTSQNRYDFATTYFGLEGEYIHETGTFTSIGSNGQPHESSLPSIFSPRFVIGGTHFWGHADFYISIPLSNFRVNGSKNASISNEVFTGFRFLPIRSSKNRLSPFVGFGFNSKNFSMKSAKGKSQLYSNWQWYPEIGIAYRNQKNRIFEINARYFHLNRYDNFIDRTTQTSTQLSPWSFSIAYKKLVDFTSSYKSERAQAYLDQMHKKAIDQSALSGFSFGLGLNALIPLSNTELAARHPFFNDVIEGGISPDLSVGYYSHKLDGYLRTSFRPLKQKEEAFGYSYSLNRNSLALEAFKYVGDYHGFAPFLGPFFALDRYKLKEQGDNRTIINHNKTYFSYGIVFGWDIRQSSTDYLVLRTNLRYTPALNSTIQGYKFTADQLEFNFIQIVFYPERYKLQKKKS